MDQVLEPLIAEGVGLRNTPRDQKVTICQCAPVAMPARPVQLRPWCAEHAVAVLVAYRCGQVDYRGGIELRGA